MGVGYTPSNLSRITPRVVAVVALTRNEVPRILPWPTHLKIPVSAPASTDIHIGVTEQKHAILCIANSLKVLWFSLSRGSTQSTQYGKAIERSH